MFTVALLTIAKIWMQPKCLSRNEQIKKMFCTHTHTHTMKQYSAIKTVNFSICNNMDGLGGHYAKRSEINKTEKDKHCMIPLICRILKELQNVAKTKFTNIEKKVVVTSGRREVERDRIGVGDEDTNQYEENK